MNIWLNYHHLYYFWIIAQEKSVSAAASRLRLAQPTLSAQLKQLEESLEIKLFDRHTRGLTLTEEGKVVMRYADTIFPLGAELQAVLKGSAAEFDMRLRVGVLDSVPKFVVQKVLGSVLTLDEPVKLECFEGKRADLFSQLGSYDLDMVLSDVPFSSEVAVKAFNHPLGSSGISLYGTQEVLGQLEGRGTHRFNHAPFLLPTRNTMLRRAMDTWFEKNTIVPRIIAEFEDSALLKSVGSEGHGLFPIASVVEKDVERAFAVKRACRLSDVKEEFFAITLDRKVSHPAIQAISLSGALDVAGNQKKSGKRKSGKR